MKKKYTVFVKSSCLLLLAGLFTVSSYTIATAQTYVQATSFTTSTYGNETVTVSTSGPVYNFILCGSSGPHFIWNGGSSVTWAFSHPVASIRVPLVFAGYGPSQSAHFTINGSSYTLTAANMKGGAGSCSDGVNAVLVGGDITNTGDEPHFPSQIIYIPGPITSVTVQNNGGATNAAVAVPMFFEIPSFDNGATQSLNVCQNASATSTNAKLTASGGTGTYGWSVVTSPAHGSLSGFSASASAGSHVAPSGTSYTPTTGYSGSDQYVIRISDGTNSSDMTMNVTVTPIPNTISGTSSPICELANTTFSNSAAGGAWTSNASSVATVNAISGVVTGIAAGTATITYSTGCVPNATKSIVVNPIATVNTVANQTVCNGANTTAINFTSPTTGGTIVYNWTNNKPSIGLAASGSGNIASFVGTNTTNAPVTATITVTPNYTNGGTTCTGTPTTSTITVNPTPTVNTIANQAICNNAATSAITFSGAVTGTVYNWTNNTPSIGLAASGTGNIASFNTTAAPVTATITVTPNYTNSGVTCVGTPTIFTITVNPKPTVSFTVNTTNQCLNPNSYVFTSTSTVSSGTMTYAWNFGDGATATGATPAAHAYVTAGAYTVKLVVTTNNGCKDSTTQTITVYPKPAVSFTVNTANQCLNPNSYVFANTSTISSGTMTYAWDLGDGTTSTGTVPAAHTYATAGIYTVKLVVTTNNGCKDSTTQTITVYPKPAVSFTINTANQCLAPNNYAFVSTSTISSGTMTYAWSFGDGTTSTGATPAAHTYATAGAYTVKLVVSTNNGCKDSTTQTITVYPKPIVAFTVNTTNQCLNPNSYTFISTTTVSSGTLTAYTWDLGDGTTATGPTPAAHTYTTAGAYTVKLVVTTDNGCMDSTTQTITIYPKPTASFTINTANQCLNLNSYTFTSTSAVSSGTLTYAWIFGDGTTATGIAPAAHTYATAGTYPVKLVVTTNNGCKDSTTQTVTIYQKPIVAFTVNTANQCLNPNSYTFISTATVSSGTLTAYAWDLGDGTTATGPIPAAHTYTTAGAYTVKLVVTTDNGCMDSTTQTVTIYPKPTVSFTINTANQCLNPNSYTFTSTSTVSSGTLTYAWDLGDGTTATGSAPAAHTYATAGTYPIKLVVTTNNGCKDSSTQSVTIYQKPIVAFTVNNANQCLNPNSYTFTSTSTVSSGTLTAYAWDLGDGATATGATPTAHTYATAGAYTVKLVVTTDNGCKDSATQSITVYPKPAVSFTVNTTNQCLNPNSYAFTSTSTISSGTITAYTWDLGDGTTAIGTTPAAHTYSAAGTYIVKLVVTTNSGCMDSTTQTVTVYPKPVVAFTVNTANQCLNPNSYTFVSTATVSNGTLTAYTWDLGDGTTATGPTPAAHTYTTAGAYTVKLVVTTDNGCMDSTTQTITIYPKPTASFTINTANQCLNLNSYTFASTSAVSSGTLTYAWIFGDGTTATGSTPAAHTYATAGTYSVTLIATSNNGCIDSTVQSITVYPKPTPSFTIAVTDICTHPEYTFRNASYISSGTMTYVWNFGDNNTDITLSPSHSYATPGTYNIVLIASSNSGCKDSITQQVVLLPNPVASFTVNDTAQCVNNNNFIFTNTAAAGSIAYAWDLGDGTTATIANPDNHEYTTAGIYTVQLTATNDSGCVDTTKQTMTIYPTPTSLIGGHNIICNGTNDTIAVILTGSGPWQLSYSDGSTPETIEPINASPYTFIVAPTESHTYIITSLSDIYCSANNNDKKGSHSVVVEEFPTVFIDKGDSMFCNGDVTQLTAHGSSDAYRWNTGDSTCCISVNTTGLYTVAIANTCGEAKDSTHLSYGSCDKYLWFPSAFTPNGDGKNDIFHSISYCQVLNYEIEIFNRRGNTVYTSNNPKQGWDGTQNGTPAEIGTYVYFVKATCQVDGVIKEVNQKGDVVLIR
jgi:gliding motility-associated-like protein